VESVAENTSDAVVGPLVWGALLGVPGLARVPRGQHARRDGRPPLPASCDFGWASARADDVAQPRARPPDRPARDRVWRRWSGGRRGGACARWRRDGRKHPSPNAGPVEAAFAGALGRTLGGRLSYGGRVEERPLLGDGRAPDVADIARAARLSAAVTGGGRRRRGGRPVAARPGARVTGGALLVAGTTSDAGKSVVTAGLCRWLAREGVKGRSRSRRRTCR
jgi:adenosylcobinamide-phosphate synthase